MRRTTTLILAMALALPLACSRDEAKDAAEAAEEAVAGAAEATQEAAEGAMEAAEGAADAAKQAADDAAQAASDAMGGDTANKCRELAAKAAWAEALEVCAKAHEEHPEDMAIEHALQQARAAAKP